MNVRPSPPVVVLLHGVALNRWFMAPLARHLRRSGWRVVNLTYPSRRVALPDLGAAWLPDRLRAALGPAAGPVHFVAHSMGCLIVRHLLAGPGAPAVPGRVVMIAPPNHGSALADRLRSSRFARLWIGCNLERLGEGPAAFFRRLPARAPAETGIIAGTRGLNPLGSRWLAGPHDGTVAVASTRLDGAADHLELPYSHTGLLFRRATAEQTVNFLRAGRFRHPA